METRCKLFETKLTNGQLICINKMITEKRLSSSKELIISKFSNGRSTNTKDLFVNEATDIIRYLKNVKHGQLDESLV